MALGPKTRRYLESKRDPVMTVAAFMRSMEETAKETAERVIQETVDARTNELKKALEKEVKRALADFPTELRRAMKVKLDSMPSLKGEPGYTPVKGKDYVDGVDGRSPVAEVDYPTIATTRKIVAEFVSAAYERMKKEGMSAEQMRTEMRRMCVEEMKPELMARALETLRGVARLDYESLKNRPGTPVQDTSRHTLHRGGGGKQTYYYDLSSLCNGVDKTFTIPANTRVLAVIGTDAPAGTYRPLVDWTGTGLTTLTLTSQVAAPATGATLYILYVV